MFIFQEKSALKEYLSPFISANKSIGFVPTMGAIHEGHLSLMKNSIAENDLTVVSIFVNPNQFNNQEDLKKYPRTLEKDTNLIASLSEDIIIFAPSVEEIYGNNSTAQSFDYDGLESHMEGANRPGHFDGVGTILTILFELIRPTKSYFGEKDFQQLQIVKKLVKKHNIPVKIIGCPIFRHENGLAMSSRNERLSEKGKQEATFIYEVLQQAKSNFTKLSISELINWVSTKFEEKPHIHLEYFEIADEDTLATATTKEENKKYRGFIVAHIENVRLIDNIALY